MVVTPAVPRTHTRLMPRRSENSDFLIYRATGDPEALARVFDALAPRLLLVAGPVAPDASAAEDLVQTTFLQAMRDARAYDGETPVGAWLGGIRSASPDRGQ